MSRYIFPMILAVALLLPAGCGGKQSQFDEPAINKPLPQDPPEGTADYSQLSTAPGAPLELEEHGMVTVDGQTVPLRRATKQDMGVMVPDGEGGMIWIPADKERAEADPNYIEARELKLKIRELCEQLISNINQAGLYGKVALPTSFVNQDDFEQSSSFGRYVSEQMFYEFNQRGFPIREYRIGDDIVMREGEGDFYLTRQDGTFPIPEDCSVVIAGTYYQDKYSLFVNARLLRPADGMVLRTAQMVMPMTGVTQRMLARSGRRLESGSLGIRSAKELQPGNEPMSVIDMGYDVH